MPRGEKMARSRRALLRKGNVTDIAEARKQREQRQLAKQEALANARISTLEEATRQAEAIKAVTVLDAAGNAVMNTDLSITTQVCAVAGSKSHNGGSVTQQPATVQTSSAPQAGSSNQSGSSNVAQIGDSTKAQQAASAAAQESHKKKHGNRTYNHEKVEAIKKAIADGTYVINPQRVADKFIERESPA